MIKKIPLEIKNISEKLSKANFQAYLVGGCVRDLLLKKAPKDWDITTDAKPEEIQKIFPESVYENNFGTVAVKTDSEDPKLKIVEITTFRVEGKYTDKRHPDEIKFAKTIEEDLSRRDFTINALAFGLSEDMADKIIDPHGGQFDIKNKIIKTVGDPIQRFNEDALRLIRAVRFAVQLDFSAQGGPASGWEIEEKTFKAIKEKSGLLEMIAKERISDEFKKIIMTPNAKKGIELLEEAGLLKYIIPELREGINVGQNKHHIYTVWEHNLRALDYAAKKEYSFEIRLASLLHDVGKPKTKAGEGPNSTFYNHEVVGAKIAARIMDRLSFSKDISELVIHLVRYHLFYYNVGEVTESGVRRFLRRVGSEHVDDLIKIREADRIGSGVPKAIPYKLRHLLFMIEKVKHDPISPKMLKVNGSDLMEILKIKPGPKVGQILSVLLEEVIEEPNKNDKKKLEIRIKELGKLSEKELEKLSKQARDKKEEFEEGVVEEMKGKHHV
ncbi:MAG: CCA tRNA nucleotidyltransferase [Patescibacteria group bacterium]